MSEYAHHISGVPSRLTDRERWLLLRLAIDNLVRQFGCTEQQAADALDHFTERGEVMIEGDARDVYLKVVGHTHIQPSATGCAGPRSRLSARPTATSSPSVAPPRVVSFPTNPIGKWERTAARGPT